MEMEGPAVWKGAETKSKACKVFRADTSGFLGDLEKWDSMDECTRHVEVVHSRNNYGKIISVHWSAEKEQALDRIGTIHMLALRPTCCRIRTTCCRIRKSLPGEGQA